MALNLGSAGKLFVKKEGTYADPAVTFAATDALRHISFIPAFQPLNRVISPEKTAAAGVTARFDRRRTAALSSLEAVLRPSGVLNTLPEADELFECAFGSKRNVTLSTTIAVAGAGTTTQDDFTSVTGLAVGDAILLTRNSVKYVRVITAIAGSSVTWAPALPSAMADGESVKGCLTYSCTTTLGLSLAIAHYLANFKEMLLGLGANELTMTFDGNEEPRFSLSGQAADDKTATDVPAEPGAFTTVGGNPPSGLIGELLVNNTAYLFKRCEVMLSNSLRARNSEYGVSVATESYRDGKREVKCSLTTFVENQATLYDLARVGTPVSILKQTGRTEGNIIALYLPKVDFDVPAIDDPDEAVSWSWTGTALATADGNNDEVRLALA